MPDIIDTHCHLTMSHYDPDRADVIKRCLDSGVSRLITIGTDIDDSKRAIELAEKHDFIFAGIGIHPHDVKDIKNPEETYELLKSLASRNKILSEVLTPGMRGVFHCFSGDMEMAEKALEMDFYISFSGVVTFKNANKILEIVG